MAHVSEFGDLVIWRAGGAKAAQLAQLPARAQVPLTMSPSTQRLLLAAAWVGTAFVAYSIGQFRTPPAALQSVSAAASASLPASHLAEADRAGGASDRPLDGGHGAAAATLESFTGGQSLEEYLKRILNLDDDIKRTTAFLEVLGTLETPEKIREALDAVARAGRGWGRGVTSREFAMLLQKWTNLDPKGAADYTAALKGRDERNLAMSKVLGIWTRQDSHAALAWAKANGSPAGNDPGEQRREDFDGNYAVAIVAAQLARTDVDRALALASEDGNSRSSVRLTDTLVAELFRQHGEEAARQAVLALPESKLRDAMLGEHADRMAKTDGRGAAQFAASLPSGLGRSRALSEAIAEWSDDDPVAAGNFLNSLPPSSDSDSARERYARNVFDKDPAGALSWAATITDERERLEITERFVRSWVKRDAENAKAWVLQSPYSAETKQRFLTPESSRGRN
jgi:hypothetical protein